MVVVQLGFVVTQSVLVVVILLGLVVEILLKVVFSRVDVQQLRD